MRTIAPLLLYVTVSVVYFGLPLLPHFSQAYIGAYRDTDPSAYMWNLAWWPYAILHGLNPFLPRVIWAPSGYNLTWAAPAPGASLLAAPLTLTQGVVVAYNVLALLAPALAAWTAYVLCRYVTKNVPASLVGGYLFGFSTYELNHLENHLNLILVFPIPFAAYLVLLRLAGEIRPFAFVLLLAATLALQFMFMPEVSATLTLIGGLAIVLGLVLFSHEVRNRLRGTIPLLVCAYAVAGLILSPYLYYMFAMGRPSFHEISLAEHSSDLLAFIIPTWLNIGANVLGPGIAQRFDSYYDQQAYLGLPLILLLSISLRSEWSKPRGKLLYILFLFACFASLGPSLRVAGPHRITLALPWALVQNWPFIKSVHPSRFMLYAFLLIALIVAVWLSDARPPSWAARTLGTKWGLAALSIVFLLPNLSSGAGLWRSYVDTPAFFTDGAYRRYLSSGENVLIIPYGQNGNSMLWQAQSRFYFRMAGGYVGPPPVEFNRWPIVDTLSSGTPVPNAAGQLRLFLRDTGVAVVIVATPPSSRRQQEGHPESPVVVDALISQSSRWEQLFSTLRVAPIRIGGVTLYRLRDDGTGRLH
jgi:hypothetical protein